MFGVEVVDVGGNAVQWHALRPAVERYSAAAVGGPDEATLWVEGDETALWGLLAWLRRRVTIRNENHTPVWWGYIAAVEVSLGGVTVGVDLEEVRNRVRVAYTTRAADGTQQRSTTAWAQDADSQAAFGVHEETLSLSDVTQAAAEARRDAYLALRKEPPKRVRVERGPVGARILCAGYWRTLGRRYYAYPSGRQIGAVGGTGAHTIGWAIEGSTRIGFRHGRISDLGGRLAGLGNGTKLVVAGSGSNNGTYTVSQAPQSPAEDARSYAASTISFDPDDDLWDATGQGLGFLRRDEMIQIGGAAQGANNGYRWVTGEGSRHVELTPATLATEAAGALVTVAQGHSLRVAENLSTEAAGANVTLAALGSRLAQSFTLAEQYDWALDQVVIQVRRVGAPADNLQVSLCANAGGSPGAVLATATLSGLAPAETMAPLQFTFATPYTLLYGTTYWLVVERTGAAHHAHFYVLGVDEGLGDGAGSLKMWTGAAWTARSPDADMPYELWGREETSAQVRAMVLAAGDELAGVLVEAESGVYSHQYRDGEQRARDEIEELLAVGDANGRRLLATVLPERVVRLYAEPDASSLDLMLRADGTLRPPLAGGTVTPAVGWDEGVLPAGRWVQPAGLPAAPGAAAGLERVFVERAEYAPGQGYTVIEPRSSAPWEEWV